MIDDRQLADSLLKQYRAALERLEQAVRLCPPEVWDARRENEPPFWQVAMHVLFYAHLYLCDSDRSPDARANAELAMRQLGTPIENWSPEELSRLAHILAGLLSPDFRPERVIPQPELIERAEAALVLCEKAAQRFHDGGALSPSHMPWIPGTALDLFLYNLRHIEFHLGQLVACLARHGSPRPQWR